MIFAAGLGTRMGALTRTRPKPLIPVAGVPLIDHALRLTRQAGVMHHVVNVHYLAEQIFHHLGDSQDIAFSVETPDLLDTGGGLKNALPALGSETVFTLNSDAVWSGDNPVSQLLDLWVGHDMDGLLLLLPSRRAMGHKGSGDFEIDSNGRLNRAKSVAKTSLVYSGLQLIRTTALRDIEQDRFSLNIYWDRLMDANRLFGCVYPGRWVDVGRPENIEIAETVLRGDDGG